MTHTDLGSGDHKMAGVKKAAGLWFESMDQDVAENEFLKALEIEDLSQFTVAWVEDWVLILHMKKWFGLKFPSQDKAEEIFRQVVSEGRS
ncbi:MAG: hypothetical protein V3U94_00510 [Candidatus Thorarchaeota archaeon]